MERRKNNWREADAALGMAVCVGALASE